MRQLRRGDTPPLLPLYALKPLWLRLRRTLARMCQRTDSAEPFVSPIITK